MIRSYILLLLIFNFGLAAQSESIKKELKQISISDTVQFTVSTSGCFDAGITVYQFIKHKRCLRTVMITPSKENMKKQISIKDFNRFISDFERSALRFSVDTPAICTMTTDFELLGKNSRLNFQNGTCQNEYHPEIKLLELLKK